jgi:hypothetical protein
MGAADTSFRPITNSVGNKATVTYPQTPEPPLAKPKGKSEPTVAPPTTSILPLPATTVPEPTAKPAATAPMPLPTIPVPPSGSPTPTIPVPPPAGKSSF